MRTGVFHQQALSLVRFDRTAFDMTRMVVHNMISLQAFAIVLLHYEYKKGKRVPALLTLYWLVLVLVDVVPLRTFILQQEVCYMMMQCDLNCLMQIVMLLQHGIVNAYEFWVLLVQLVLALSLLGLSCILDLNAPGATHDGDRTRYVFCSHAS